MMTGKTYWRRAAAALVSLLVILSVSVASVSAPADGGETGETAFVPAAFEAFADVSSGTTVEYTAAVENGRVVVRNQNGEDRTNSGNFAFEWRNANSQIIVGFSAAFPEHLAETPGTYHCRVMYVVTAENGVRIDGVPFENGSGRYFIGETILEVIIDTEPRNSDYTARVYNNGSSNNGILRLEAAVLNESGTNVTNSGNFEFQWQRSEDGFNTYINIEDIPTATVTGTIITGARTSLLSWTNATNSGYYRCRVTYIGSGETIPTVFYTGIVNWNASVSYTTASWGLTPGATSGINANHLQGINTSINAQGALTVTLNMNNSAGQYIYYSYELYRTEGGEKVGEPLCAAIRPDGFSPAGSSWGPANCAVCRSATPPRTTCTCHRVDSDNSVTIPTGFVFNGEGAFVIEFKVSRTFQNGLTHGNAFDITSQASFDVRATAGQSNVNTIFGGVVPVTGVEGTPLENVKYPPNETSEIIPRESSTLTVTYVSAAHTITFHLMDGSINGETAPVSRITESNNRLSQLPPDPIRDGYVFEGWLTEHGEEVTTGLSFFSDTNVYAQWAQVPEFSFTDETGVVNDIRFLLLPSDTDDSGILSRAGVRVYFKISEFLEPDDDVVLKFGEFEKDIFGNLIKDIFGENIFIYDEYNCNPMTFSGIHPVINMDINAPGYLEPIPGFYYFYLSNTIINMLDNGTNEVIIQGSVLFGEEKYITVRKIGLFRLH